MRDMRAHALSVLNLISVRVIIQALTEIVVDFRVKQNIHGGDVYATIKSVISLLHRN